MSIFNHDSPLMIELRKATDIVLLGLLWTIASVPLFTFGAATTAMYYTLGKTVRKEKEKLWKTFWSSFKREFKQATLLWVFGLVVTAVLAVNGLLLVRGHIPSILFALLLAAELFGVSWMQLWYGYLSRFEDKVSVVLGNTFRIALVSIPKLIVMILIFGVCAVAAGLSVWYAAPTIFLVPGLYAGLTDAMLGKIFKPYLPEETAPEEALPAAQEESELFTTA